MESNKKNGITQFLIIGTGTAVNMVISLVTTQIITRLIEPSEYGQYSIFIMYGNLFLMALCLGLDQSLVRFFYDKDTTYYRRSLLKLSFTYPIIVTCILGVAFLLLIKTKILIFEFSFSISIVLVFYIIGLIWNRLSVLILRITYSSKYFALCNIFQKCSFLSLAVFWICVIRRNVLFGLAIALTVSTVSSALLATTLKKEYWKFRDCETLRNKKKYFKFGLPLIVSLGLTSLFQAIDKISLNHYCSYEDVGVYSSAMTIIHVFAIIQTAFNSIWAPMQVEHYVKHPEDKTYIQKANQLITFLMFALGIHLILFKELITLILGEKYRSASQLLPFLIFNPIMYTISETTNSGIGISQKSYLNILVALVSCGFNYIGNTILVPALGPKGAAISTGVSYVVFFAVRTFFSNRYYYIDYKLWKLSIMIISVSLFAYYETNNSFSSMTMIFYLCCMTFLIVLYRKYIFIGLEMVGKFVREKLIKRETSI